MEPLIHGQLIFTNVQRQSKREGFFFLTSGAGTIGCIHKTTKKKRTLISS